MARDRTRVGVFVACMVAVSLLILSGTRFTITSYQGAAQTTDIIYQLDPEVTSCTNTMRVRHLRTLCQDHPSWGNASALDDPEAVNGIFVDEKHRIVYCSIPKVGSTTVLSLLAHSLGYRFHTNAHWLHDRARIYHLSHYNDRQRKEILKKYLKFMVVRHPLDRLVSCYFNKFNRAIRISSTRPIIKDIAKAVGRYLNISSNDQKFYLTMNDFMTLLGQQDDFGFHNGHWASYHSVCHPCDVTYDHVVRLDQLGGDLRPILARLRRNSTIKLKVFHSNARNTHIENINTTKPSMWDHLKEVDTATIQRVIQHYARDFLEFGYDWKLQHATTDSCQFKFEMDEGNNLR